MKTKVICVHDNSMQQFLLREKQRVRKRGGKGEGGEEGKERKRKERGKEEEKKGEERGREGIYSLSLHKKGSITNMFEFLLIFLKRNHKR
jgi:hypothetical protein